MTLLPFAKYNKQVLKAGAALLLWCNAVPESEKQDAKAGVEEEYEKKKDKNYLYLRPGL